MIRSVELHLGDCLDKMGEIEPGSVHLIVTSPPYDNLRNYSGTYKGIDFEGIAKKMVDCLAIGGVIVWVSGDETVKGSETGTSFKQALYFTSLGLNLHDTMIYAKRNYMPLNHNRYEQSFEYMFVLSKGRPRVFNPIKIDCKIKGKNFGVSKFYKTSDDTLTAGKQREIKPDKIKRNIWEYRVGSLSISSRYEHPAMFPLRLAIDHIRSWSNEGDTVMDPFMGSGTVGDACNKLRRNFVGIEINEKYFQIAKDRLNK